MYSHHKKMQLFFYDRFLTLTDLKIDTIFHSIECILLYSNLYFCLLVSGVHFVILSSFLFLIHYNEPNSYFPLSLKNKIWKDNTLIAIVDNIKIQMITNNIDELFFSYYDISRNVRNFFSLISILHVVKLINMSLFTHHILFIKINSLYVIFVFNIVSIYKLVCKKNKCRLMT